ncbi:MAG: hypothetical protein IJ711_03250 [Lachnospiraceae bacterium]|nr:hypothetical protein [Lachnospiraceae bacterium]
MDTEYLESFLDFSQDERFDVPQGAIALALCPHLTSGMEKKKRFAYEEQGKTELELAGLDPEELEWMSAAERREVLEGAGLNPEEFDF